MTAQKIVFICQFVVWALMSSAHAQQGNMPKPVQKLPAYPPVVCVTTDWKITPCADRDPKYVVAVTPPAQTYAALEGTKCLNKDAKTMTAATEPCKFKEPGNGGFLGLDNLFPPVIIRDDQGGTLKLYVERYKLLKERMFVIDGDCNSACTLVLGLANVCTTSRGRFNFHAAYIAETGAPAPVSTKFLMDTYPEAVRAWINANGGLTKEWLIAKATMFVDKCKEGT